MDTENEMLLAMLAQEGQTAIIQLIRADDLSRQAPKMLHLLRAGCAGVQLVPFFHTNDEWLEKVRAKFETLRLPNEEIVLENKGTYILVTRITAGK